MDTGITGGKRSVAQRRMLLFLLLLLLVLAFLSLRIGRYHIAFADLFRYFVSLITGKELLSQQAGTVIALIRIPRILMALLVGAALAASGASYQSLFRNPLVSPDILGVSAGAAVGASLAILLSMNTVGVQIMAFAFGLGAVSLVVFLSMLIGRGKLHILIMVLSGIVISALFSASTSLLKYLADTDEQLPEITFWLMGSLARTGGYHNLLIMAGVLLVGGLPLWLLRWKINVLTFGEEARTMGVNTRLYSALLILLSTLLTASSVAFCGVIGWIGLIVPHMARMLVGPNFMTLLPTSMLIGGTFVLAVDDLARSLIVSEIPLGILTSFLGAPFFIYLFYRSRRNWL